MSFFYVPQKDDEIARLRKELESRKPRGLAVNIQKSSAVNTQKSSAVEQVRKILPVKIQSFRVLSFYLEQRQRNKGISTENNRGVKERDLGARYGRNTVSRQNLQPRSQGLIFLSYRNERKAGGR